MLTLAKDFSTPLASAPSDELSAASLFGVLAQNPGKPLIFSYDGRDVQAGYHVTEVKSGTFEALDCGANPESWRETFIQLWDIPPADDRGIMSTSKFLAIVRKVGTHFPFHPDAKLTFEVSDGETAMRLYRAASVEAGSDAVRVVLTQRPASCKPRDRWLQQQRATGKTGCCGPSRSQ
jgi:hypothetical protein